jgi:hypothetical protein
LVQILVLCGRHSHFFVVYLKYTDHVRHLAKGTISTYPHVPKLSGY